MALKKQKYYVVWHGHKPGIYSSWETCQAQIKNFPNAAYKSFLTKEEAEEAFYSGPQTKPRAAAKPKRSVEISSTKYNPDSISVDAACSGNPGIMEYRGVWTADTAEIFHLGPFKEGTNNIGEFLALVHALALLEKKGDSTTPIYSDSRTAMAWVARKKANTALKPSAKNAELFELIRRAETWLKTHQWKNKVVKWDTQHWGEIPADFGRK